MYIPPISYSNLRVSSHSLSLFVPLFSYAAPEILLTAFDPFLTLQLRCCGAEGPEDWARSVFNGFRDLDHAPEIGIPRTQADVVGGMALTAALPKVTMINDFSSILKSYIGLTIGLLPFVLSPVQHPDLVLQDRPAGDGAVPGGREGRAADEHT